MASSGRRGWDLQVVGSRRAAGFGIVERLNMNSVFRPLHGGPGFLRDVRTVMEVAWGPLVIAACVRQAGGLNVRALGYLLVAAVGLVVVAVIGERCRWIWHPIWLGLLAFGLHGLITLQGGESRLPWEAMGYAGELRIHWSWLLASICAASSFMTIAARWPETLGGTFAEEEDGGERDEGEDDAADEEEVGADEDDEEEEELRSSRRRSRHR